MEILRKHGKALAPTLNYVRQNSILHMLALKKKLFDEVDKDIFKIVFQYTYKVTRNRMNRSFLETAVAQKSVNLDYMLEKLINLNLVVIRILQKNIKIKSTLIRKV